MQRESVWTRAPIQHCLRVRAACTASRTECHGVHDVCPMDNSRCRACLCHECARMLCLLFLRVHVYCARWLRADRVIRRAHTTCGGTQALLPNERELCLQWRVVPG